MHREPLTASVLIEAEPDEVYEYFTRAEAMVRWMGHAAVLDARPGGEFAIDINDARVRGLYQQLDPPNRLIVTWGFAGSHELPPGASTLEVLFTKEAGGTRVQIIHHALPQSQTAKHAHGWHHFLPQLALAIDDSHTRVNPLHR
jgi:uncharacterized protein YndB with AHSA1/START domain